MDSKMQLDLSLKRFSRVVNRLLRHPCLGVALEADIASMEPEELLDKIERDLIEHDSRDVLIGEAEEYIRLVDKCLSEFQRMIPGLNGDGWHVDLYREQMQGREDLIRGIIGHSGSSYGYN